MTRLTNGASAQSYAHATKQTSSGTSARHENSQHPLAALASPAVRRRGLPPAPTFGPPPMPRPRRSGAAAARRLTAADGARAFVARAERELRNIRCHQARPVGERDLHHRRHRRARRLFRHDRHRDGRRLANEAARYQNVPGLDYDTAQAQHPAQRASRLPAPTTAGAAAELNRISTDLQSTYGSGRGR